jgi:hypothetical protein
MFFLKGTAQYVLSAKLHLKAYGSSVVAVSYHKTGQMNFSTLSVK